MQLTRPHCPRSTASRRPLSLTLFASTTLSLALSAAACSPPATGDGGTDASSDAASEASTDDVMTPPVDSGPTGPRPEDCDPLDETACSLPWPSNLYLRPDPARRTGYTLAFGETSLPFNDNGDPVDPTQWRRLDGYGLGVPIMTVFPRLDASMLADEYHVERSMAADAPVLLYEVSGSTLTRVPYFCDLDAQNPNVDTKILYVRPAVILKENARYVVAFRNLRNTMGQPIAPSRAFTALRDRTAMSDPRLAPRVARFEEVFTLLGAAGITRESLLLAWDFQTGSTDGLHSTLLRMRDEALAMMPMGAELRVTEVKEFRKASDMTNPTREVDDHIAIEITGQMIVPSYIRTARLGSISGIEFNRNAAGAVAVNGTRQTPFWIRIPYSALDGTPHDLVQYGHGLLGDGTEVRSGWVGELADREKLIFFAANMTGMSTPEYLNALASVENFENFRGLADGLHQGQIEWVLLARAMKMRFGGLMQAMARNIRATNNMWYTGESQGAIFGVTYMAIARDITRGQAGVGGFNYSTLLHRSIDFAQYLRVLRANYGNHVDESIGIAAIQLLWDQTDPVSYVRHVTAEPFTAGEPHYVFMSPARGDHQVSAMTNEIAARSNLGIVVRAPYDDMRPMPYGIMPVAFPQRNTSALVLWHYGNPWPPAGNRVTDDRGEDPHGMPRRDRRHQDMMMQFFRTGEFVDTCMGNPC